jgi:tyrosine phenol-lyase
MATIIEPFRIKMVEPIRMTTRAEREQILQNVGYNLFNVKSDDVLIDLLTDSGTSAMSTFQWAGILEGDESYAGARSYYKFEKAVQHVTGYSHIIPTHQGRAAEKILFAIQGGEGKYIPNNTHFDTTRANVEFTGAQAPDLVVKDGLDPLSHAPFKGNMDTEALDQLIQKVGKENVPIIMMTITNNANGGQPVSMENIKRTKDVADKYGIPLFFDACRFAENAYFIKMREKGYEKKSALEIAQEIFQYGDGCTMSAKKDALVNIGGYIALNDDELAKEFNNLLILTEGFSTYGGMAGRDLEAIAIGLEEVLHEDYLEYRITSTAYLGNHISEKGVPIFEPPGGHAIFIDAARFLPHIPLEQYPGQSLAIELFLEGGIRSCEIGTIAFGRKDPTTGKEIPAPMELVRLAIPRRVYTQSHMDYVIEVILEVFKKRDTLKGVRFTYEPDRLRHFTAQFEFVT